jgi:hypothetical protein
MEELCGVITCRGTRCVNYKSKCIFHRTTRLRRKKDEDVILFNSKGRKICGVKTTCHNHGGLPCKHVVSHDEDFCIYHKYIYPPLDEPYRSTSHLKTREVDHKEYAEILLNLENVY